MLIQKQPLFYFPSTIIVIDDNSHTINEIISIFDTICSIKTFTSAKAALNFLHSYKSPLSSISFLNSIPDDESIDSTEHCTIDFNLLNISQIHNNSERFNEISIILTDSVMPDKSGLELCHDLHDTPMKKILFTGRSEDNEAVSAFNKQIINHFIRKDSPTFIEELIRSVQTLTTQYFIERSKTLLDNLEATEKTPLSDKAFIHFFQKWREKNSITEYYLIDKVGSFLCINIKGEQKYFLLHTDNSLDTFIKLNESEVENSAITLLQAVRDRKLIPFFGIGKSSEDVIDWAPHFFPTHILEGVKKYYWSEV